MSNSKTIAIALALAIAVAIALALATAIALATRFSLLLLKGCDKDASLARPGEPRALAFCC